MKYIFTLFILSVVLVMSVGCNSSNKFDGLDTEKWKGDRDGCNGARASMKADLIAIKDQLKGMSNKEIVELLGRPDKNELYTRNQKYFLYHLSPRENCPNYRSSQEEIILSIRFNALGLANEVLVYD